VTIWMNTPIQMQSRVIDGLSVRFAQSGDREDHALLLSPWPESLLAFEPMWERLAARTHLVAIDAIRPWTPQYHDLQRPKMTHHGTEKKRPA
jgi:hypothetical protein